MASTRANLLTILTPLVPKGFRLDPSRKPPDAMVKPTWVLSGMQEVERTPATPQGARSSKFLLTLIEPDADTEQGGDRLEDAIETTLTAIERSPNQISHGGATRVKWGNQTPNAFDIPITVITPK